MIKKTILSVVTLPSVCAGLVFACLARVVFGGRLYVDGILFVLELDPRGWFARGPYRKWAGTTIGNGIMYKGNPELQTIAHELEHVRQCQTYAIGSLLLGAVLSLAFWNVNLLPVTWFVGMWFPFVGGFALALLRGERFYRDSTHERAAYAVAGK